MNREERRAAARQAKKDAKNDIPQIPGNVDMNDPDAPDVPQGLARDVFEIAALVNTVKATFKMKEETALKTVDLAISVLLATKQMNMSGLTIPGFVPPGAKPLTPDTLEAVAEEAGVENEEQADAAPETHHHQEDA